MTAWGIDEEARADVVGTASARLLAAGVPRPDRLGAMRLLGILTSNADEHGIVRRPLDDLAGEFDLPADRAVGWLAALVGVGIVHRGIGVLVLAGLEPPANGGIRLADFLATVEAADADDAFVEPVAAPRTRTLRPVPALASAAVVLVLLALVPLLGGDAEAPRRVVPVVAERPDATQGPTETTSGGSGADPAPEAPMPVVVPSTTTTVVTTCPVGAPLVEVIGIAGDAADGLASVEGVARNATSSDVELDAFTVVVEAGGETVEVAGIDRPLVVPAGETVRWVAKTPAAAVPGATATVEVDQWRWADGTVQRACG